MSEIIFKKKNTERISKAQDTLLANGELDYVLEVFDTSDFVEVIGKVGGDTVTHRVYNDGMITER